MTTSGIYENFSGDRPNVCLGPTIFGLTSTTGISDIYDINFAASVDDYVSMATAVGAAEFRTDAAGGSVYDLGGRRAAGGHRGAVVSQGKTVLQ